MGTLIFKDKQLFPPPQPLQNSKPLPKGQFLKTAIHGLTRPAPNVMLFVIYVIYVTYVIYVISVISVIYVIYVISVIYFIYVIYGIESMFIRTILFVTKNK